MGFGVSSNGNEAAQNPFPRLLEMGIGRFLQSVLVTPSFKVWEAHVRAPESYGTCLANSSLDRRWIVFPTFFPFITWLRIRFRVALSTRALSTN